MADPAPPPRPVRRCAVCSKPVAPDSPFRPFCSKRCANIDLGRWLKESYRVETDEGPMDDESGDSRGNGSTGQER